METKKAAISIPVWTWRDAVRKAKIPPLTKLVCYAIANYLSDVGDGCYPSVKTLMADTGLTNRSIATHLQKAVYAQLLRLARSTGNDGRFKRTTYFPRFPDNTTLPREPSEGGDRVKEVHPVKPREGGSCGPRERDAKNRVNLVHEPREGCSRRTIHRKYPKNTPVRAAAREVIKSDLKSELDREAVSRGLEELTAKLQAKEPAPAAKPSKPSDTLRSRPVSIKAGAPSWSAWLEHLKSIDRDDVVCEARDNGHMIVPCLWPPKQAVA